MEGKSPLEWQGRDITLRRGPRGNVPFGAFSAVYTGTQEPVPGLTADTCGELLLGVGREVYERSAFLGQSGSLAITAAPELERRIAALVSSGGEEVSYTQAEGRLKEWLNRRRVNKSVGRIPQLEEELSQVKAARAELEQLTGALNALSAEEKSLRRKKEALEEEMPPTGGWPRRSGPAFYPRPGRIWIRPGGAGRPGAGAEPFRTDPGPGGPEAGPGGAGLFKGPEPELKQGEEALAQAEADLERARAQAEDLFFSGMTGEEAVRKAAAEAAALRKCRADQKSAKSEHGVADCPGSAGGCGVWLSSGSAPVGWLGWECRSGCAILLLVGGIAWGGRGVRLGRQAEQILARLPGAERAGDLPKAADYQARAAAADQAAQQVRLVREGLSDRQARLENSRKDLFDFVHSFAPEVKDLFGCSAALSRALNLGERQSLVRTKLEGAQRLYDALQAQGGRRPSRCPSAAGAAPHPGGDRRPAGHCPGRLGAHQPGAERDAGRQKAAGDPAALAARAGGAGEGAGAAPGGVSGPVHGAGGLQEANALLQERFSPQLNRRAGEYLARLTGAKYTRLSLSREMEAAAAGEGEVLAPPGPLPVQGDGGSGIPGRAPGGV